VISKSILPKSRSIAFIYLDDTTFKSINYLFNYLNLSIVCSSIMNRLCRFRRAARIVQCLATDADVRWRRCIRHPDAAAAASVRRLPGSPGTATESTVAALRPAVQSSAGILSTGWLPPCHAPACAE